jgi:hypothetical protein
LVASIKPKPFNDYSPHSSSPTGRAFTQKQSKQMAASHLRIQWPLGVIAWSLSSRQRGRE